MKFDYFEEIKEFNEEHARMRQEYRMAGMSDEDINEVFAMDWEFFKSERREAFHRIEIAEQNDDENSEANEMQYWQSVYDKVSSEYYFEDHCLNEYVDWLNPEDLEKIRRFVSKLTKNQREIFEKYVYDHKEYGDIAKEMGTTRACVSRQMIYIRKKFKKFF